ncbi:tau tubulin kinase 2b [Anaeramoeba ignava]|uniref:Tau tubulin kinase 2b n=1 Tax=Anaeramoeba ignava TaxID=1746090 RepID=A0A9Q0LIB6_ANAIG|nr:tau tubulin kinase 2b [Anaeramoeba ignava]|eukprot:Anaeramoba_ignava/a347274_41.p1 GENE.a347274_41~~a347274_41.p1  ORF type:complete len:396 (-),score=146.06 a347274_41:144-1331(-)
MTQFLKNRWLLNKKIGEGSFGEIYQAYDSELQKNVAIKFEKKTEQRQTIKLDIAVIHQSKGSKYIPEFIYCGQTETHFFLVMELLGENLSQLRRKQKTSTFSLPTTIKLAIDMICGIEFVHSLGYIHRDIKPSNFAIKNIDSNESYSNLSPVLSIFDFGLSRKYIDSSGKMKPSRESVGFRGTARYASVASHEGKELGRKDDLISLFYCLIEFLYGKLMWSDIKDKQEILNLKTVFNSSKLPSELPHQFTTFFEYINSLKENDEPNYSYLKKLLINTYVSYGFAPNLKFDWEKNSVDYNLVSSFMASPYKNPNLSVFNFNSQFPNNPQNQNAFSQKFMNEVLDLKELYGQKTNEKRSNSNQEESPTKNQIADPKQYWKNQNQKSTSKCAMKCTIF